MQVSVETTSSVERQLTIGVPADEIEREVEQRLPVVLEERVVDHAEERLPLPHRLGREAVLDGGLVVRLLAEPEQAHPHHVEVLEEEVRERREHAAVPGHGLVLLGEEPGLRLGVPEPPDLLGERVDSPEAIGRTVGGIWNAVIYDSTQC